jgi:glycosyltransferase involved in cell wall biosynthesis
MIIKRIRKISLVIPTYNRWKHLKLLLDSIENLSLFPKEVIIINDCSRDQTRDLLDEWKEVKRNFNVIVYHSPINRGPGAARNIGIQLASGNIIAFTDDDCIISRNWIKQIINSKYWKDDKIAGIGGRVLPYRKNIISEYYTFHRILEPPKYNQYLVTANAAYRKKLLLAIKGFDEEHKYPGGEDNGLSFKLVNRGYKFEFEKNMVIFHNYRNSFPSLLKTFFRYGKGCAETTIKYLKKNQSKSNYKNLKRKSKMRVI